MMDGEDPLVCLSHDDMPISSSVVFVCVHAGIS